MIACTSRQFLSGQQASLQSSQPIWADVETLPYLYLYTHCLTSFSPTPKFQCQLQSTFLCPFQQEIFSFGRCTCQTAEVQERQILDMSLFGIDWWQLGSDNHIRLHDLISYGEKDTFTSCNLQLLCSCARLKKLRFPWYGAPLPCQKNSHWRSSLCSSSSSNPKW